jgi:hypothetical protein
MRVPNSRVAVNTVNDDDPLDSPNVVQRDTYASWFVSLMELCIEFFHLNIDFPTFEDIAIAFLDSCNFFRGECAGYFHV